MGIDQLLKLRGHAAAFVVAQRISAKSKSICQTLFSRIALNRCENYLSFYFSPQVRVHTKERQYYLLANLPQIFPRRGRNLSHGCRGIRLAQMENVQRQFPSGIGLDSPADCLGGLRIDEDGNLMVRYMVPEDNRRGFPPIFRNVYVS